MPCTQCRSLLSWPLSSTRGDAKRRPSAGAQAAHGAHNCSGPCAARSACFLGCAPALLQGVVHVQVADHGRVLRRVPAPPALKTGTILNMHCTHGALAMWGGPPLEYLITAYCTPLTTANPAHLAAAVLRCVLDTVVVCMAVS